MAVNEKISQLPELFVLSGDEYIPLQIGDSNKRTLVSVLLKMINYNGLSDKPQIGGIELSGNKTLDDLGIQVKGDYATKNELLIEANKNKEQDTKLSELTAEDIGLQTQIDALNDRSDVVDIVASKAELVAYNTAKLTENDVIKVLKDESHKNEITYYRWKNGVWNYVGSLGSYYTKAESDSRFVKVTEIVDMLTKTEAVSLYQPKGDYVLKTDFDFWEGVNTVSTLVNLPVTKRSIVAIVTSATDLSLVSDMEAGKELYVRVFNDSANEITQAIPNAGKYVSMSGASVKIPSKSFIEISIWCYESGKYSIRVGEVVK